MKITIIGAAGCVGSATAFHLAVNRLADEIVMIGGSKQNVLLHHAMDISTAVTAQDVLVRAGTYEDMAGSDIVINAAGIQYEHVSARTEMLSGNLAVVKEIAPKIYKHCPEAVVITATNPIDPLNYAMYLLSPHRDRNRLFGHSRNDSVRFQMLLARALGVRASQLEGTVIGEHGRNQVLCFSSVRVSGKPADITEEIKQEVRQKVSQVIPGYEALKADRTAGWTTAAGLAVECRAISQDTNEMIPCSVVLDGEYGVRGLSMGVPAIMGKGGMKKVLEWKLASDEQEGLDRFIDIIRPAMQYVEEQVA